MTERYRIHHGDCLEVMQEMEEDSVDSICCDPPYGLSFMGKNWDHGIPGVPFWEAALRVAKPGAPAWSTRPCAYPGARRAGQGIWCLSATGTGGAERVG